MISIDLIFLYLKRRFSKLEKWLDGKPVIVVKDGKFLKEHAKLVMVDEEDVLSAARELQGLKRMDEIEYAVLEANGSLSIIPKRPAI